VANHYLGLYLSDVLATSWNCVVDTGVSKGDVVAIWGAGPIGQMAADFSLINGASRVIMIDNNWRLDYVKSKYPNIDTLDYTKLPRGESVTSKLMEMVPRGPDVALECVAGEYAKGWAHYFEMLLGLETDSSEIINEMITSVKNFGRCGITGVYAGFVSIQNRAYRWFQDSTNNFDRQTTLMSVLSWKRVSVLLEMDKHQYICIGRSFSRWLRRVRLILSRW
jgi:threonine dehydrogenase-like Zn-dependent dehydrogenase